MGAIEKDIQTMQQMQDKINRLERIHKSDTSLIESQRKEIQRLREALHYYETRSAD